MSKDLASKAAAMDYIKALEEERKKIIVFERELPLSLQLVTQAIETCKQKQQIPSEAPVVEEFISLRPSYSSSDEVNNQINVNGAEMKPDWLRSVQLWNQQQPEIEHKGDILRKPVAVNATRVGGAFHAFEREKVVKPIGAPAAAASSTTENTNGGSTEEEKEKEKEEQSYRKARRCWSPELHRRFLDTLQQLGGSHAATPKQIRELMNVNGLTNDEVKSHLQKYRLHTRRPTSSAAQSGSSCNPQQPQIVLVGGIWMPPPEYTAAVNSVVDATGAPLNRVYAPVASLPSQLGSQQKQNKQNTNRSPTGPLNSVTRPNVEDDIGDGEMTNSDSSATSSSSQTTTTFLPSEF